MRVVAGRLGGRRLRPVPGTGTRPTSDRVREALFAILGDAVAGARVLDLFAGTGALAIEALSRGAASAVLVEQAPAAAAVIRANLAALGLEAQVHRTKAETYVRGLEGDRFDLVLCDPPYALGPGALAGLLARLAAVALAPGALVVVESASRAEPPVWPPALEALAARRYGDTALHLARFAPGADAEVTPLVPPTT